MQPLPRLMQTIRAVPNTQAIFTTLFWHYFNCSRKIDEIGCYRIKQCSFLLNWLQIENVCWFLFFLFRIVYYFCCKCPGVGCSVQCFKVFFFTWSLRNIDVYWLIFSFVEMRKSITDYRCLAQLNGTQLLSIVALFNLSSDRIYFEGQR